MPALPPVLEINLAYQYEDRDIRAIATARIATLPADLRNVITLTPTFDLDVSTQADLQRIIQTFYDAHRAARGAGFNGPDFLFIPLNIANLQWGALVVSLSRDRNTPLAQYIHFKIEDRGVPAVVTAACAAVFPTAPADPYVGFAGVTERTANVYYDRDPKNSGVVLVENLILATSTAAAPPQPTVQELREAHVRLIHPSDATFYERQRDNVSSVIVGPASEAILLRLDDLRLSEGEFARTRAVHGQIAKLRETDARTVLVNGLGNLLLIRTGDLTFFKGAIRNALLQLVISDMNAPAGVDRQTAIIRSIVEGVLTTTLSAMQNDIRAGTLRVYDFKGTGPELLALGGMLKPRPEDENLDPQERAKLRKVERLVALYDRKIRRWDAAIGYVPLVVALLMTLLEASRVYVVSRYDSATQGTEIANINNAFTYAALVIPALAVFLAGIFKAFKTWNQADLATESVKLSNLRQDLGLPPLPPAPQLAAPAVAPPPVVAPGAPALG